MLFLIKGYDVSWLEPSKESLIRPLGRLAFLLTSNAERLRFFLSSPYHGLGGRDAVSEPGRGQFEGTNGRSRLA